MDRKSSTSDPDGFRPRRTERHSVGENTKLRQQSWYDIEVKVQDVSTCGFRADCSEPIKIGSYVSLDVPGIGPVHAQIRWQIGACMGGMFLDPISLYRCEWTAKPASPPLERA